MDTTMYVYIDTTLLTAGSEIGVDGRAERPVNNIDDAEAIAAQLRPYGPVVIKDVTPKRLET